MKEEHVKINYICGLVFILVGFIFFLLSRDLLFIIVGLVGVECFIIGLYGDKRLSDKNFIFLFFSVFMAIILMLIYLYNVSLNNFGEHNKVIVVILAIMVGVLYFGMNTGRIMIFGFRKVLQFNRGIKLAEKRKYGDSLDYFDEIIKKEPDNPLARAGRAYSLQMLGKNEEALESVDNALDLKFEMELNKTQINLVNSLVFNMVGVVYFNLENYEGALEYADKALELGAKSNAHNLWDLKGIALIGLGRSDEAINCFDKALKLKPNSALLLNNKANAFFKLGKNEEAMEYVYKGLKIDSKLPMLWVTKGEIYRDLGKNEEALEHFDKALKLDPDFEPAKQERKKILSEMK